MGRRAVLLLLLWPLCLQPVFAAEWQQLETASAPGEVATWVREVPDSPIKDFRGVVVLDSGPLPVIALLADAGALQEWIFQCSHSERLADTDGDRLYLAFDAPWPVSNRDVVVENRVTFDAGSLVLRSVSIDGVKPPQDGLVRIPRLNNRFRVTPLENGNTRVTFQTFVDPGGSVPAWLSNFVATKAPLRTLRGMRDLVKKRPWRDAGLSDLPALPAFRALDFEGWLDNALQGH